MWNWVSDVLTSLNGKKKVIAQWAIVGVVLFKLLMLLHSADLAMIHNSAHMDSLTTSRATDVQEFRMAIADVRQQFSARADSLDRHIGDINKHICRLETAQRVQDLSCPGNDRAEHSSADATTTSPVASNRTP